MINAIKETLGRRTEDLDEGQQRMTNAANDLFKVAAVAVRLQEFDVEHAELKRM